MTFLETLVLFFAGMVGIVQTHANQSPFMPGQGVDFRMGQEAPQMGGGGMMGQPPGGDMMGGNRGGNMGGDQGRGQQGMMGQPPMGGGMMVPPGSDMMGGNRGNMDGDQGRSGQQGFDQGGEHGQKGEFDKESNEEQDTKRQAQQDAQCTQQSVRMAKEFETRSFGQINKLVLQLQKQKIVVPASATEGIEKMKAVVTAFKAVTMCDEMQDAQTVMEDSQGVMEELMPQLHMLSQTPRIKREIMNGFKTIDRRWKSTLARAKSSKKIDLTEPINEGNLIYGELKAMFDEMITVINSGDMDAIEGMMEKGEIAREKADELEEISNMIDALKNSTKFVQDLSRQKSELERIAKDLQRKKLNVGELTVCLGQFKSIYDQTSAIAKKPTNMDALMEAFEGAQDALQECKDIADNLRGLEQEGLFDDFFGDDLMKQIGSGAGQ